MGGHVSTSSTPRSGIAGGLLDVRVLRSSSDLDRLWWIVRDASGQLIETSSATYANEAEARRAADSVARTIRRQPWASARTTFAVTDLIGGQIQVAFTEMATSSSSHLPQRKGRSLQTAGYDHQRCRAYRAGAIVQLAGGAIRPACRSPAPAK